MANRRRIVVEFIGEDKSLGRTFSSTDRAASSWSQKIGGFAKGAALGLAGIGLAAGTMGMDFVRAAEESQKVTGQTEAVLKSMGLAGQVSADQIANLSEKLSLKSGVDDELIQSGQNVLLTFGELARTAGDTGGNFDRATQAALDMSVALGTDMQSASMQVGKALNDPIRGLATLRRSGIQFTAAQEDQIRAMVEAGDVAGAQALMLDELERQFGGSAEAQATASDKLGVAWGNLQETLGEKLLPVVERFTTWATESGIPAVESLIGWIERNKGAMTALAAVVGGILVAAFVAWGVSVIAATWPILAIGVVVGAFALLVVTHWDTIRNATVTAFNAVKGAIAAAFNWVKTNWPLLLAILTGPIGLAVLTIVRHWGTIKAGFTAVKTWIGNRITDIVGFFTGLPGRLARAAGNLWGWLSGGFKGAINSIIGTWNNLSFPSFTIGGWDPPGPGPTIPSFTVGGWSLPDIPYLSEGGIATRPMLAEIGHGRRGEAVVPLDEWNGGGNTYVTVDMSGAIIASQADADRWVSEAWNRAAARGTVNVRGRRL